MNRQKIRKLTKKETKYLQNIFFKISEGGSYSSPNLMYKEITRRGNPHKLNLKLIQDYFKSQVSYTIQKHTKERVLKPGYDALFQGYLCQFDLSYMTKYTKQNNEFKYILGFIDTFSKYAAIRVLKSCEDFSIAMAMKSILEGLNFKVYLLSDLGSENKGPHLRRVVSEFGIKHYFSQTGSAYSVERLFKTIKHKLGRYFIEKNTRKYIYVIDKIILSYNKTRPIDINRKNQYGIYKFQQNQQMKKLKNRKRPYKFSINDKVLISLKKDLYFRELSERWSREIFTIFYRYKSKYGVNMYKISTCTNEVVVGTFYENELNAIKDHYKFYQVDQVIDSRKSSKLVSFKHQPKSCQKWISNKEYRKMKVTGKGETL